MHSKHLEHNTILHGFMHMEPEWFPPQCLLSSRLPGTQWGGDRKERLKAKNYKSSIFLLSWDRFFEEVQLKNWNFFLKSVSFKKKIIRLKTTINSSQNCDKKDCDKKLQPKMN